MVTLGGGGRLGRGGEGGAGRGGVFLYSSNTTSLPMPGHTIVSIWRTESRRETDPSWAMLW